MDDLELHDDDIPEFEFPHLRENRAERYERARKLLEAKKILDDSFKETWLEIIELPETSTDYGD